MAKKHDEDAHEGVVEENGSRIYELGFHLDPELPSEEVKKAYGEMRDLIERKGALVAEGEPEKIALAYTISRQETSGRRDFSSAYFAWIAYETSVANHEEVLAAAKADTRIVRFIDLVTTREAARNSAELRELSKKTQRDLDAEQGESEAELDAAIENVAV